MELPQQSLFIRHLDRRCTCFSMTETRSHHSTCSWVRVSVGKGCEGKQGPGSQLANGFIEHDTHRCGKVEASHAGPVHRNSQQILSCGPQNFGRQAPGLRSEQKAVPGTESKTAVVSGGMSRKAHPPVSVKLPAHGFNTRMNLQQHMPPIVQPGPFEVTIREEEPQGFHKMERSVRGGARPGDIAGVLGNLRFNEHYPKWKNLLSALVFLGHEPRLPPSPRIRVGRDWVGPPGRRRVSGPSPVGDSTRSRNRRTGFH